MCLARLGQSKPIGFFIPFDFAEGVKVLVKIAADIVFAFLNSKNRMDKACDFG